MRTIRVTGKGQLKVRPDTTRITMTLTGLYPEYGEALCRSAEDTEALKSVLANFGFERSDVKTISFAVDTEYESCRDASGDYRQIFAGYRFRHVMKVEFESDNDRLGRILYALARCSVGPEFRISYTVKDPEATKNQLLGKAVTDAAEKAAVLARAGGVALGNIQSIDYSWGEVDFEYRPMRGEWMIDCCEAPVTKSCDPDIEPDDIDVSDTVTVVWNLA